MPNDTQNGANSDDISFDDDFPLTVGEGEFVVPENVKVAATLVHEGIKKVGYEKVALGLGALLIAGGTAYLVANQKKKNPGEDGEFDPRGNS